MASTRKPRQSSSLLTRITAVIRQHVKPGDRLFAGFSGGMDSMVLLDLLHRASKRIPLRLHAVHVNHRISPEAGRWAAFCRTRCRERGIPCKVVEVSVSRGDSMEAAARRARYQVFGGLSADFVVLAHTLDDQAETVLLQLLRGAGVKGMSAMPVVRPLARAPGARGSAARARAAVLRPLLDVARSEIEEYASRRKLAWVEDESNADTHYDRNFIRHQVLPLLAARYPSCRQVLARTSRNLAEAAQLLDELAATDGGGEPHTLDLKALRRLSLPRAKNVIRFFLARHGTIMPNTARLDEYVRQLASARAGARATLNADPYQLVQSADRLHLVAETTPAGPGTARAWRGERDLALPELGGVLRMTPRRGRGMSVARLLAAQATIRIRHGGERLRIAEGRPHRSLKNLFQEARVPAWLRGRTPLLFAGESLVCVPGLGMDPAYRAGPGEPGVTPEWVPDQHP